MNSLSILRKLFALTVAFMAMLLVTATMAFAAPAAPGVFTVKQADGTVVKTIAIGDEHQSWMETEQGHTIAKGVDGNWYYAADPTSGVHASGPRAKMAGGVNVELSLTNVRAENPPLANLPKHIKPPKLSSPLMAPMFGAPSIASAPPVGPHSGNMLILMVDFTDRAGTYTATDFSGFFNSVATYYNTVSNGNVTLTSSAETHGTSNDGVIGWLRLPYAHPNGGKNWTATYPRTLIQDAITAAAPYVNFDTYDTNADGRITGDELAIIVFAAGYENSYGGAAALTPNVWGHASWGRNLTIPGSTKVVDGYTLMGEIHGTTVSNSHQGTLGIVVHELGHLMFQWPDLYDYDFSSEGIGNWCLMSGGSWGYASTDLYGGQTPVMPSAWLRKKSGWVNTQPANGPIPVTAAGADTATANNTVVQAVTSGLATEYFLLENRQNQGYDRGLQGLIPSFAGGLAIWHIDDSVPRGPKGGLNENDAHRLVNLEAPDGWTAPAGNRGAATNLWYSGNGVSFDSLSTPNSNLHNGTASGVSVSAISTSATIMTATFGTGSSVKTFTIFNDGSGTLNVSGIQKEKNSSWLSFSPAPPFSITAGNSQIITVIVDPNLANFGTNTDRLIVSSDDPDENPYPGGVNITLTRTATTYIVTPSAGGGGTISPSTAQTVNSGSTTSFTVTPNSDYRISSVTGCGGALSGNTYTTGAITADCTVAATFASGDTPPPAFTSTSPASNSYINTATVGYTLSAAVASGKITFTRTGGSTDSATHIYNFTESDKTAGTHSVNTGLALINGAIYTVTFDAADLAGNAVTAVSNTGVVFDNVAASVVIISPPSNSLTNSAFVSYTLNTEIASGEIVYTRTGGSADGLSPHKHILGASEKTAGSHTVDTGVTLIDGAIYTISFENVTDKAGNATASVSNTSITYDLTAVAINNTTPASNAIITNSSAGYTLSEAASSGKVTFTRSGGNVDSGSPHVYTLIGSDLYIGSHTVITNLSLVDGAFYTVSFDATDYAGNPATTVSNAMVYYDMNYSIGPLGNVDNSGYSLNRIDGYDLIKLSISFGSKPGDANWNPACDLNKDQKVDGSDLIALGTHFGEVQ